MSSIYNGTIYEKLTVDVSQSNEFAPRFVKQGDAYTRGYDITLTDGGEKIEVPTENTTVWFNCRNQTDPTKRASITGTINSNGTITVKVPAVVMEVEGYIQCDVSIITAEGNDTHILKSTLFYLACEAAANPDGTTTVAEDNILAGIAAGTIVPPAGPYVPKTRKIAGLELSSNITKADLINALQNYAHGSGVPTPATSGIVNQIYIRESDPIELYMCVGHSNNNYNWVKISDSDSDRDVEKTVNNAVLDFSQTAMPNIVAFSTGLINSSGVDVDSSAYYRSDYIAIDKVFKYKLFAKNTTDSVQRIFVYAYDDQKVYVQSSQRTFVLSPNTQSTTILAVSDYKYIRICITSGLKNDIVRLYYDDQISVATKEELRTATFGMPKNITDYADYFARNKKVVLIGDSITQGLGSTGIVTYTDDSGYHIYGNGAEYGVEHNLSLYQVGKKLYSANNKIWYEAIDGSGYAHRLKNYLQNKFGCEVKNYGISGITSGTLIGQTMTAENSDLVTSQAGTVRVFEGLTNGFDTVLIMIGTNDRGFSNIGDFSYNLNWIVNNLLNVKHKKVILLSATPALTENLSLSMSQINATIKSIAENHNIPFISVYDGMNDYCERTGTQLSTLLKADGLHPNDDGYDIVNSIICDNLGIENIDKNYIDKVISQFSLSDSDKQDIAQMVYQMMTNQ